jgi:hypothetical protein
MDAAATIAALAIPADRARAKQLEREVRAEMWADAARDWAEGALRMRDPVVTARWYLRSGYCRWMAMRQTCKHRAAVLLAAGLRDEAMANVREGLRCMREARNAARLAERAVA